MPTLPTSVAESMQGLRLAAEQAARMLKARPALLVLAGITWGIQLVSEYDTAFAFVTTLMKLVFSAAFFGVVAEIAAARGSGITWKLVGSSIRSLTIGTVVITTAYTLPVLIGARFLTSRWGRGSRESAGPLSYSSASRSFRRSRRSGVWLTGAAV